MVWYLHKLPNGIKTILSPDTAKSLARETKIAPGHYILYYTHHIQPSKLPYFLNAQRKNFIIYIYIYIYILYIIYIYIYIYNI